MKKLTIYLLLVYMFYSCESSNTNDKLHFNNLIKSANKHLKKSEVDKALKLLNEAEKISNSYELYFIKGNAFQFKKNVKKAIIEYDKATKINPNDERAYFELYFLHLKSGDYKKAIYSLDMTNKAMTNKKEQFFEYHRRKGQTFLEFNDYENALKEYNIEISLYKKNIPPYLLGDKGIILYKLGRYKESYEYLKQTLHLYENIMLDGPYFRYMDSVKTKIKN